MPQYFIHMRHVKIYYIIINNFIDDITDDELNMLNEIKIEHVKKVESLKKELQDI